MTATFVVTVTETRNQTFEVIANDKKEAMDKAVYQPNICKLEDDNCTIKARAKVRK